MTHLKGANSYMNDPTSLEPSRTPAKWDGKCTWNLGEDGEIEVTIYFEYIRQYGLMYVTEIDYTCEMAVEASELKEAVMNELGPDVVFQDTEIIRS